MNKTVLLVIAVFGSALLFSQETELEDWNFYSQKDTVKLAVKIPHTWNVLDAFDDEPGYWRGKGHYITQINIKNSKKAFFLHFNGANQHTKVWVNTTFAGEHKGGYTAFDIDISEFIVEGENTLKVEVDNQHNEAIPPLDADFTFYGGVYRSVYLVEENKTHFKKQNGADAIKIDALLDWDLNGKLVINGAINDHNISSKFSLNILLKNANNQIISNFEQEIDVDFNLRFDVHSPELWSPQSPNLYDVELRLYKNEVLLDSYHHKIGFRNFEVTTENFKINGTPLKLVGVNRHQDWDGMGNAVPVSKQIQDLVMIKAMGANFLRLAHYPQDKAIYKAADSLGLILWSEIPVVNKVPVTNDYSEYKSNALLMQKEHIAQNYNHPSLIFIGYMNEIFLRMVFDNDDEPTKLKIIENSLELANLLENLTRSEAPYHKTVMALHGNQIYNETGISDIPMVIGWNLYYGWYEGEPQELGTFLDAEFEKYPNRPLIISEYGVGADSRIHNSNPKKFDFSEEYQFEYHPSYYKQIMERPFVVGMSAWNFSDFGSEFRGDAMPHVNQKGLVNFNRTPKNIYNWYQTVLHPEKGKSLFFRGIENHLSKSSQKEIIMISNQDVELKVNTNESIKLIPENGIIKHVVFLEEGINSLNLFNHLGVLQDSMNINYITPDFKNSRTLSINFGTESYFHDSASQIWVPISELPNIEITGSIKTFASSTNIRNTFDDPIYQSAIGNVEKITLDLPKGMYNVTLLFSKLNKEDKLIYELNKRDTNTIGNATKFLKINGKKMTVEPMEPFNKQEVSLTISVKNSLVIESFKNENFTISGLKLKRE